MKYEILVWLVARLFGFRLWSDNSNQKVLQLLSPIDFIGSLGVGMLAALPVGAVSSIVELFVEIAWLQPWIGWVQAILTGVGMLVMLLAMFT